MPATQEIHARPDASASLCCKRLKTGQKYRIVVPRRPRLRNPRWLDKSRAARSAARVGQQLWLCVEAGGLRDGSPVEVELYVEGHDAPLETWTGRVQAGRVEVSWRQTERDDVAHHRYTFVCRAQGQEVRSGPLQLHDDVWLELCAEDGETPRGGVAFVVTSPDGAEHRGLLDGRGRAYLPGLPAGAIEVRFAEEAELREARAPRQAVAA